MNDKKREIQIDRERARVRDAPCMDCIEPAPPATAGDMPSSDGVPPISSASDWCEEEDEDEEEEEEEALP